jgi:hypothetical protein
MVVDPPWATQIAMRRKQHGNPGLQCDRMPSDFAAPLMGGTLLTGSIEASGDIGGTGDVLFLAAGFVS